MEWEEKLYLEGEIFRRLPFSRTKFGKRMGALARRLPALQRHRPITDLKLITRDGRTDVRTDPPSVLLGAVAVRGGRRESSKA